MIVRLSAWCVLLAAAPWAGAQEKKWSERFPEIARRVPNLDKRLAAQDVEIRKQVFRMLTTYRPRDSKVYPPFFRALFDDPSPVIRGLAVQALWEHHVFPHREELPESFDVHFVGEFFWKRPAELERVRKMAQAMDGWAMQALAIVGDKDAIPLARAQLASSNVFVRHSAAMALVQLGQRKEGIDALHQITDAKDDVSGFYRIRAAEDLFRLGQRQAIETLFDLLDNKTWNGYTYGPRELVEDLMGEYFLTTAEARAWWRKKGRAGRGSLGAER